MEVVNDIELVQAAAEFAIDYVAAADERHAAPSPAAIARLAEFDEELPESAASVSLG